MGLHENTFQKEKKQARKKERREKRKEKEKRKEEKGKETLNECCLVLCTKPWLVYGLHPQDEALGL